MPSWMIPSTPWETWLLFTLYMALIIGALRLVRFVDAEDVCRGGLK